MRVMPCFKSLRERPPRSLRSRLPLTRGRIIFACDAIYSPPSQGTAVQVRRHFQQGEFPSSHHREEGWPSDQENTAQHPLLARTGWCSDRTDKEHHPGGVDKGASRHFLGDTATPPRGDARRGIRFFQNDTSCSKGGPRLNRLFLACAAYACLVLLAAPYSFAQIPSSIPYTGQ